MVRYTYTCFQLASIQQTTLSNPVVALGDQWIDMVLIIVIILTVIKNLIAIILADLIGKCDNEDFLNTIFQLIFSLDVIPDWLLNELSESICTNKMTPKMSIRLIYHLHTRFVSNYYF